MTRSGSIQGCVTAADGRPIAEASVIIVSGPSHVDLAAVSTSDGRFTFGPLNPGTYVLKAWSGGLASDPVAVVVSAGVATLVDIKA